MEITWCVFLPLLTAAILVLVPSSWKGLVKSVAILGAILTFVFSIGLVRRYNDVGDGTAENASPGQAIAVLQTVQEQILKGSFAGQKAPMLGFEKLGDPTLDDNARYEQWKAQFLPEKGVVFSEEQYEEKRLAVRALAGDAANKAELAWKRAVEVTYAMNTAQAEHLAFAEFIPWIPNFGVNYFMAVDGLSLPLMWLTALLTILCLVYSWTIDKGTKGFYILFLVLETGLLGVFCAMDFFLFYCFWEVVLLPMYFLIGIWGGKNRLYASIKFFIYTLVGSVLMLIVMLVMYFTSAPHTFNLLALMEVVPEFSLGLQWWLFLLLFIGFAIKVPIFPFHTWLPDAHVEAPTAVSVMLAGILLKMGGYGLLRFNYGILPEAGTMKFFICLLAILGMVNIVYGAFCALAQKDFKRLVAYSSVSHMGYVLLGLAALSYTGVQGATLQMFNHGVSSAMMFLIVGVIYDRAHHRDLTKFGGIGLQMPWYTGLAAIGFFASLGLPGLNGFISEAMCFIGAWDSTVVTADNGATPSLIATAFGSQPIAGASGRTFLVGGIDSRWIVIASLLGIVLGAAYILWTIQRVYLGTIRKEEYKRFPDVNFREVLALVPLAFLCIALGVYPSILIDFMDGTLSTITEVARSVLPAN